MPQTESSIARRRPQFSLRWGLLLVAVVAVMAMAWTSYQRLLENRRLLEENKRLRVEVGELEIEKGQEGKLYALKVKSVEELTWKWRLHVPERNVFRVCYLGKEIPARGLPERHGGAGTLPVGEQTLIVGLRRDRDGEWQLAISSEGPNGGMHSRGQIPVPTWNSDDWYSRLMHQPAAEQTISTERGTPLELLRIRTHTYDQRDRVDEPAPGLLLWIDETPLKSSDAPSGNTFH